MRIIGGQFKGRKFYPPADKWPTRPTTDFAKEGLFNILQNRIDLASISVLDLFGGTGSHGYEFISRGCQDVTYVDKFGPAVNFVKKTSKELKIEDHFTVFRTDVFRFIKMSPKKYDYIFAGPPYELPTIDTIPDEIFKYELLKPEGLFVMEHNPNHEYPNHPHFKEARNYGKTIFSFFK